MKQIKQAIASFTAFSFLLGTLIPAPSVYADGTAASNTSNSSGAGQVINGLSNIVGQLGTAPGLFTQNPQQLQMQSAISSMQVQMNACLTKAVAGSKTVAELKSIRSGEYAKMFQSKLAKAKGEDTASLDQITCYQKVACDTECKAPENTSPTCENYSEKDQSLMKAYINYLSATATCANKDFEALQKQKEVLDCQMQVLQQGVNQASQTLQQVLEANATQYGKMNQYMGELGDQMGQISALVGGFGPDGKEMPGKWTELQKTLYDKINQTTTDVGNFKTAAENFQKDTDQNEAFLKAVKAQRMGACLEGSNPDVPTPAVLCWRPDVIAGKDAQGNLSAQPKLNKNGCPVYIKTLCSPLQAASSAIEMSHVISNGQPYQDPDRCAAALSDSATFQTDFKAAIAKLGSSLNSWTSFAASLQSGGANSIGLGKIMQGASRCTQDSNTWAKDTQDPKVIKQDEQAKQYDKEKTRLANKKTNCLHNWIQL